MHIAALRMDLRVDDCRNLRQKRRLLGGMIGKLRRHFNVSAAEVDRFDRPTETVLAVVTVAHGRREAREALHRIADAVGAHPHAELANWAIYDV
jgi:uncharacterized protein YlxP (DUF503 family)